MRDSLRKLSATARLELGQLSWFLKEQADRQVLAKKWRARRGISLPALARRPRVRDSVWAVTMVRDEADIISHVIQHLFDQGVDHILVSDNRSVDATPRILAELAARNPRLHLATDAEPAYFQAEKMTRLAQAATRAGADWMAFGLHVTQGQSCPRCHVAGSACLVEHGLPQGVERSEPHPDEDRAQDDPDVRPRHADEVKDRHETFSACSK